MPAAALLPTAGLSACSGSGPASTNAKPKAPPSHTAPANSQRFSADGLNPDAPNAKTGKDAKDALTALAKADKDADRITHGG